MGIINLMNFLNKFNIEQNKFDFSHYKNKKIGIDISNILYKILYIGQKNGYDKNYYLTVLNDMIIHFLKNDVTPVFIFDGCKPEYKRDTMTKISNMKKESRKKLNAYLEKNINDKEIINILSVENTENIIQIINKNLDIFNWNAEIKKKILLSLENFDKSIISKYCYQCISVNNNKIENIIKLIKKYKLPYVFDKRFEADPICGYLYKIGYISACISDDSDYLTFGVGNLIKNFNVFNYYGKEFNLGSILKTIKLNYSEFVDFCVLCGNDYINIVGLGPKNSYDLVKKYTHENILDIDAIIKLLILKNKNRKRKYEYKGGELSDYSKEFFKVKRIFEKNDNLIDSKINFGLKI